MSPRSAIFKEENVDQSEVHKKKQPAVRGLLSHAKNKATGTPSI
jgi:hypothetical protein